MHVSAYICSTHILQEGRGKRHQVLEPSVARKLKRVCSDSAEAGTNLYVFQ